MTDYTTDTTIVHRIIGCWVEEWRLENSLSEIPALEEDGQKAEETSETALLGEINRVNFLILGSHANPVIDLVNGVNQIMNPEAAAWTTETGWRLMFVSEAVPAAVSWQGHFFLW